MHQDIPSIATIFALLFLTGCFALVSALFAFAAGVERGKKLPRTTNHQGEKVYEALQRQGLREVEQKARFEEGCG